MLMRKTLSKIINISSFSQRYSFSSKQHEDNTKIAEQRQIRLKQLQSKKQQREQLEIKKMNENILNTKTTYSPLILYIKIYRKQSYFGIALFAVMLMSYILFKKSGKYVDPFTGQKSYLLFSCESERSINLYLESIFKMQIQSHYNENQTEQSSIYKTTKASIEQYILSATKRSYKVIFLQSQTAFVLVLPQTILISKNLILGKYLKPEELNQLVLTMETFFIKKYHLKELSFANWKLFLSTSAQDIQNQLIWTNIYTRPYRFEEITQTLENIQAHYQISQPSIKQIIQKCRAIDDKKKYLNFNCRFPDLETELPSKSSDISQIK